MPANTLLVVVEGPHDAEFCARLMKHAGFSRIQSFESLKQRHPLWRKAVPEKWPQADDLLARHPVPLFLDNDQGQSAAITNANGLSKIAKRLNAILGNLDRVPDAVGVILDSDEGLSPQQRVASFRTQFSTLQDNYGVDWPASAGVIHPGPPRAGIFVMPDNQSQGTLEDLLLEAGEVAYPALRKAADNYIGSASQAVAIEELEEFHKPAGRKKATAAAMASILKPGKAIQVSIQDNRWLDSPSLALPRIKALSSFLTQLLN